ncbi:MAG TPA: hypothetical protein VFB60_26870 [Ktedonobacteraceae bacterium]|nr:hypothetical protein [Ktedonobacteraceae bacterium]
MQIYSTMLASRCNVGLAPAALVFRLEVVQQVRGAHLLHHL